MMFSNVVNAIDALLTMPPGAYVPLLMFVLIFWFLGKVFRSLVLDGHWVILGIVALGCYAFAGQMVNEGQHILSLIFLIPMIFIGVEAYKRLTRY